MVRVAGAAPASPVCRTGALLLNYTRKKLPGVDSHHDDPSNNRTCYFDITGEIGALGRIRTCTLPLRRRLRSSVTPRGLKLVGQVGIAPTFPCSQNTDLHSFDLCPDTEVSL